MKRIVRPTITPRILVCAATFAEARACTKGILAAGAADRFEVLQTGAGVTRARSSLARRLDSSPPPIGIVSTGFAGSRNRDEALGTWAWGRDVSRLNESKITASPPPQPILQIPLVWKASHYLTVSSVITDERDGDIDLTYADAVDMESYAWASIADAYRIPIYIIRVISDTPDEPLPEAIKTWVQGKKLASTRQMVGDPLLMARFFKRSNDLLKDLTRGWAVFARFWP